MRSLYARIVLWLIRPAIELHNEHLMRGMSKPRETHRTVSRGTH